MYFHPPPEPGSADDGCRVSGTGIAGPSCGTLFCPPGGPGNGPAGSLPDPAVPGALVSAVSGGPVREMPSVSWPGWFVGSAVRPAPAGPGAPVPWGSATPKIGAGYWPGWLEPSPP